ncbi:MAG: MBL fold metallo-hydrolase, partial [Clostridia bacterium]|nr:MBL fold metallo-hydrolase [Clostridia bacterium]
MKKTYVTSMPDHIGAFLKASRCFAALNINITRVSFNKAVDSHTLFFDAEGTEEQLKKADSELARIGYLKNNTVDSNIVLLEFCLKDVPGSVTDILTLIYEFSFNISYISSQENGTDYQYFKMGLYVDDSQRIKAFIKEAEKLCKVRLIEYSSSEKVYDNSIFYNTYVMGLSRAMGLSESVNHELLVHVNLAMQTLDEQGLSPYRTFDSIGKFAELLGASKNEKFDPRISHHRITEDTEVILIEPPCGSNTIILKSGGRVLFIDSGYACYSDEMRAIFKKLLPDFDTMEKTILLTHADVDHCGLLPMFDRVLANGRTARCLQNQFEGKDDYRETNPLHKPYINICKLLTSYRPVDPEKITVLWNDVEELTQPLT